MSILTRDEILAEIEKGGICIEPFDEQSVGPASLDLRLGNVFRVFKKVHKVMPVRADSPRDLYKELTEKVTVDEHLLLMPGETVLGMTLEKITLPPDISGWLEGRSTFARLGLLVHISASFMQPGIANKQVLEMTNFGPAPLAIYPGTAVCQFIFERSAGKARYEGGYRDQDENTF